MAFGVELLLLHAVESNIYFTAILLYRYYICRRALSSRTTKYKGCCDGQIKRMHTGKEAIMPIYLYIF